MNTSILFDDVKLQLTKYHKAQFEHPLIPIFKKLGVRPITLWEEIKNENIVSRTTIFNIYNGMTPRISKELESIFSDILKETVKQSVKISQHYKKQFNNKAITELNAGIKEARHYLANINESLDTEIDYCGIGDPVSNIDEQEKVSLYVEYMGE